MLIRRYFCKRLLLILFLLYCEMGQIAQSIAQENIEASEQINILSLDVDEKLWLDEHQEISVGLMSEWPPLDYVDDNGVAQGIGARYVQALNQRLGNRLKIISGSWKDIYEGVKERRIDVLLGITPRSDREAFFNFTKPYLIVPHVIVAASGSHYAQTISDLKGKRVAVEKGFFITNVLNDRYPSIKVLEYSSTSNALDAVSRSEADAYIGNRAVALYLIENELITNLVLQGKIDETSSINAIGVRKDWTILRNILQKALNSMGEDEVSGIHRHWISTVYEGTNNSKTKAPTNNSDDNSQQTKDIIFSEKELNWINRNPVILVSNETDYPPFDFTVNGVPKGYSIDLLNMLSDKIGIKIQYVNGFTWVELVDLFRKGELDLLHTLTITPERQELGLFSVPYKRTKNHFITRKDNPDITDLNQLAGKVVTVGEEWAQEEFLKTNYPEIERLPLENTEMMLNSVSSGQAYAAIFDELTARYFIQHSGFDDLKVSGWFREFDKGESKKLHFMTQKNDPELISILNKAYLSLTTQSLANLDNKWFG